MRVIVLGSGAGGGVPQWNCACAGCAAVRAGRAPARTQASLAVSGDGQRWFLVGASPDVRAQIEATPALLPRPPRRSPIAGVVLHNAEVDATLGLFSLRERHPLAIYATAAVRDGVQRQNALSRTLERAGQATWRTLPEDEPTELADAAGERAGLTVTAVPAPGKVPLHLAGVSIAPEHNVGLTLRGNGRSIAYFPAVAGPSADVERACREAQVVLFDGTFWTGGGLADAGVGTASAADMAHWPLWGKGGSVEWLSSLPAKRKVLVHVNNTNPILVPGSAEQRLLAATGIELAHDGLEVSP